MNGRIWYTAILALAIALPSMAQPTAPATPSLEDGIRDLAKQLATTMADGQVRKLAVIEFSDLNGYRSALGLFIAEELTTQLFASKPGAFDVVERQQLAKVLQEQKLGATSLLDAETIAKIGKILGIQAIVTGSIADLGDEIKINARSISVETAKVFAAESARCQKKGVVENLMRQGAGPGTSNAQPAQDRPAVRQIQASEVFFQNSFLLLTVDSLAVSKESGRVTLALRLENLTTQEILLSVSRDYYGCEATLMDNQGNIQGSLHASAGGIGCLRPDSVLEADQFTRFSPKSRNTLIFSFGAMDKSGGTGNIFAFSSEFLIFEAGTVKRFSVGISNIELKS